MYVKFYGNIFIFFPTLSPQPIGPAGGGLPPPWCGSSAHPMTSLFFPLILSLSYLIDLPIFPTTASHSPRFAPKRQGKTQDSTEGKSREKMRLKAAGV